MTPSLLLVTTTYPPVVGGSEVEGQRVCAGLRQRGWRVSVLCLTGPQMPEAEAWEDSYGTPVQQLGRGWPGALRGYGYALGVAWEIWRRRGQYEVVYFLMTGLQLATGLPAARLCGKTIWMKFSGSNTIRPLMASGLGRLELRFLDWRARVVMVLNPAMADEAKAAGLPAERLEWMPNPVDTARFAPLAPAERAALRERLGLAADAECIVFVGRMAPEKELPVLVRSFARVAVARPAAELILIGDGPERAGLEAQVRELGLAGRVRFTGFAAEDSVREWLRAADLFALLSSLEGFPVSLLEAMATGVPAVVSDIPANVQLIGQETGGLVTPLGDDAAVAVAMERLLSDAGLRARVCEAGRALVEANYTQAKILDRYEELLARR